MRISQTWIIRVLGSRRIRPCSGLFAAAPATPGNEPAAKVTAVIREARPAAETMALRRIGLFHVEERQEAELTGEVALAPGLSLRRAAPKRKKRIRVMRPANGAIILSTQFASRAALGDGRVRA